MQVEIKNFSVNEINFNNRLSFKNKILTNKYEKALNLSKEGQHIIDANLHIIKFSDNIPLIPVKEILEPTIFKLKFGGL